MDGVKPRLTSATPFNSTALVRLLAGLGLGDGAPSPLTLAERWSPWLAWTDAIALSAVMGPVVVPVMGPAIGPVMGPGPAAAGVEVGADRAIRASAAAAADACRCLRQELSAAITRDPVLAAAPQRMARAAPAQPAQPSPAADMPPMDPADFSALRRQYQTHQQAMDTRIGALRGQLRSALQSGPPALARLAALDAVLDSALAGRQRQLLASVPGWLDQHFKRRPPTLAAAAAGLQRALLAELDLRLLPLQGLVDALAQTAADAPGPRP